MQRPPLPLPARHAHTAKPLIHYCTGAADALGPDTGNRRFWPITESLPARARRMACIDFSAFDDQPAVVPRLRDATNAEFWEAVANRELTILRAAKILAKQLHSDVGVPTTLGQALAAMETGIANTVERAILAHEDNKGTNGQELRKLLRAPL